MKLSGEFLFMGVDASKGFKDPTKTNYQIGLIDGLDSVKLWIREADYTALRTLASYSRVQAVFDYNTFNGKMNFVSCSPVSAQGDKKTA